MKYTEIEKFPVVILEGTCEECGITIRPGDVGILRKAVIDDIYAYLPRHSGEIITTLCEECLRSYEKGINLW